MNIIKKILLSGIQSFGYDLVKKGKDLTEYPVDFTPEEISIYREVKQFTMTSPERIQSIIHSIKYLHLNFIKGAIVECGVWKGGSIMAVLKTLMLLQDQNREIFLFDTFEGMPKPSDIDKSIFGMNAKENYERTKNIKTGGSSYCYSSLDEVKANILTVGYNPAKIHFIKGRVENTIPQYSPKKIALLRLDTDWYESTLHELNHLFPRLVEGGILIIDDYGHWEGAKKAVNEYIEKNKIQIYLARIDYTGVIGVKQNTRNK